MGADTVLEMKGISKRFPGVLALDKVDFSLKKGSVHALVGENGAGKSTMMKILMGIYAPDEGEIRYKGKTVQITNSRVALDLGISMIHQELCNVGEMTVSQNIYLGREPLKKYTKMVDFKKMDQLAESLMERLNIEGISPKDKMNRLSIAQAQMVEIVKAVSYDSDVIIMDEPTSAISEHEVRKLFNIINTLKAEGRSVIYISHKMDEIFEITDEVTVFCDGKLVGSDLTANISREKIIQMMVGRKIGELFYKREVPIGQVMIEVSHFSKAGMFDDVSFQVRSGEILGIAGLVGAGRTEVVETIFGLRGGYEGDIIKNGEVIKIRKPMDAIKNGIVLATEDRRRLGLVLMHSARDNIVLPSVKELSTAGWMKTRKEKEITGKYVERVGIKIASQETAVSTLSGGNQQKIVLAKWLVTQPDVLILDEPTRGIDVGAKAEIYKIMNELARNGKSIIMISSEMPEILGLSDRIVVMNQGKVAGTLTRSEATQEKIMGMIAN